MITQTDGFRAKAFEPRNLLFYFLLVFGLNLIMWVCLAIFHVGMPTSMMVTLPAAGGPTLAAFLITAITEGKTGVKALWRRFWNRYLSFKWLLVTLLCYETLRLATNLTARAIDGQPYPIFDTSTPLWMIIPLFIGAFISSGIGEEFGWRGYVLPRFQAKWNALTSSIILGIIWAVWHIPAFFIPNFPLYQTNFWEWVPLILLSSVVYTWIFNNTKGSVLAVALIHAALNTSVVVMPPTASSTWYFYGIFLLSVILIMIIFGPKNFVRKRSEGTI